MSRIVEIDYLCYACDFKLKAKIEKPRPGEPTVARTSCPECDSRFLMFFKIAKGIKQITYGYFIANMNLGLKGKEKLKEKQEKQNPPPIPAGANEGEK